MLDWKKLQLLLLNGLEMIICSFKIDKKKDCFYSLFFFVKNSSISNISHLENKYLDEKSILSQQL